MTKTSVIREELTAALKAVSPFNKIVEISAENGKMTLSTEGKFSAEYSIPAEVEGNFDFLVDSQKFSKFISKAPENVEMTLEGHLLNLKISKKAGYTLIIGGFEEKSIQAKMENPKIFSVDCKNFCEMIKKIYPAVSTSEFEERKIFKSVIFEVEGGKLNLLTSDKFRIAKASAKIENAENAKFAIRADVLKVFAINAATMEKGGDVTISYNNEEFEIKFSDYVVRGILTEGEIPAFEKELPKKADVFATIQKSDFLEDLAKIEMVTKENESNAFALHFLGGQGLNFHASNPNIGNVEFYQSSTILDKKNCVWVKVADVTGTKEIALNAEVLKKAISALNNGEITIGIARNEAGQEVLSISENNNDDFIFAMTPLKSAGSQISRIKDFLEGTKQLLDRAKAEVKNAKAKIQNAKAIVENTEVLEKIEGRIAEFKTLKTNSTSAIKGYYENKIPKSNEKIDSLKLEVSKVKARLKNAEKFGYHNEKEELEKKIESLGAELKAAVKEHNAERKNAVKKEISEDKELSFLNKKIAKFENLLEGKKAAIKEAEEILSSDYAQKAKDNLKEIQNCYESLSNKLAELEQTQNIAA